MLVEKTAAHYIIRLEQKLVTVGFVESQAQPQLSTATLR